MSRLLALAVFVFLVLYTGKECRAHIQLNGGTNTPSDTIEFLFEFDMKYIGSSTHIDLNYRYVLGHLIEILQKNESWTVHIRGHVCCGPNERISIKRAKKVYKFLLKSGIDEHRMDYKGYSDRKPIAFPEKTEEDEAENRRVDFIIRKNKAFN